MAFLYLLICMFSWTWHREAVLKLRTFLHKIATYWYFLEYTILFLRQISISLSKDTFYCAFKLTFSSFFPRFQDAHSSPVPPSPSSMCSVPNSFNFLLLWASLCHYLAFAFELGFIRSHLDMIEAGELLAAGGSPPVRCIFRAFALLQFIDEFFCADVFPGFQLLCLAAASSPSPLPFLSSSSFPSFLLFVC